MTNYNLLEEAWIPVLHSDGGYSRVGIRGVLKEAPRIRQIASSNPMDNVALVRFLLAVLIWCKDDVKSSLAEFGNRNMHIPEDWLAKLDHHSTAFNLLGDDTRFYQDASLKGKKARPIADLLVEFPGADSVNHMRHVVHDGSYGFCPGCCALGILRLSVWAPANRFYPASVNPGSAAYVIDERTNLLLTLAANLPEAIVRDEQAPWLSIAAPDSPGAVACLAWRPRKLWLNVASEQGTCANCGSYGVLVTSLCNEGGWPTPKPVGRTKRFWDDDPHLMVDGEPISLPGLGANAAAHASRFWRKALPLCGARTSKVVAIGPVVNKFTFQDATFVALRNTSAQVLGNQTAECAKSVRGLLKRATPNPGRQHPEINAAVVLQLPDTEAQILHTLKEPGATAEDTKFVREIYGALVEKVVASTTRGSPLRRRAARNHAQALLTKKIKKLVAAQATSAKPERRRKKKESAS